MVVTVKLPNDAFNLATSKRGSIDVLFATTFTKKIMIGHTSSGNIEQKNQFVSNINLKSSCTCVKHKCAIEMFRH